MERGFRGLSSGSASVGIVNPGRRFAQDCPNDAVSTTNSTGTLVDPVRVIAAEGETQTENQLEGSATCADTNNRGGPGGRDACVPFQDKGQSKTMERVTLTFLMRHSRVSTLASWEPAFPVGFLLPPS
jgi:hypothetical protein